MFYLDLFQRLEEQQVRYLLVGGLAMNLHGVPRWQKKWGCSRLRQYQSKACSILHC